MANEQSARKLRIVDEHGEVLPGCPNCAELDDQLAGAEKEIRAWRARYAELKRDRDHDAREHNLWGKAVALFTEWRIATNHMRSGWTGERFWLCQPYLQRDGFVTCRWAVWGIAYECNTKVFPTGYVERYDSWELCFKNRGTFERYVNRGYQNPTARESFAEAELEERAKDKPPQQQMEIS
jgi:hypothetical protein